MEGNEEEASPETTAENFVFFSPKSLPTARDVLVLSLVQSDPGCEVTHYYVEELPPGPDISERVAAALGRIELVPEGP